MRLRYVSVTYSFGGSSPSLDRHYRELREAMLHPGQHYAALQPAAWRPPMDINETDEAIVVKAELAGLREDAVDIALYDNALIITGQRDDDSDHTASACYHEAQVRYGPFRAEIALPSPVESDAAEASYENGFLRIRLPKVVSGAAQGHRNTREGHATPARTSGDQQLAAIPMMRDSSSASNNTHARAENAVPVAGEQ